MGVGDWAWAGTQHSETAQDKSKRREKKGGKDNKSMATVAQDRDPAHASKGLEFNQSRQGTSG
jgi:hypothetical protein